MGFSAFLLELYVCVTEEKLMPWKDVCESRVFIAENLWSFYFFPRTAVRKIASYSLKHELQAVLFPASWPLPSVLLSLSSKFFSFCFNQQYLPKILPLKSQSQFIQVIRTLHCLFYILPTFRYHTPEVEVYPLPKLFRLSTALSLPLRHMPYLWNQWLHLSITDETHLIYPQDWPRK